MKTIRLCAHCDAGLTYGREQRCRACRELRHRERNRIAARLAWRTRHERPPRVRERFCPDCGASRGVSGAEGRCPPCAAARKRTRDRERKKNAQQVEQHRIYCKAYAVYPCDPVSRRRLLAEWGAQ